MKAIEIGTMEKGEYRLLVADKDGKPVTAAPRRKSCSWPKCLCLTLAIFLALVFVTGTIVFASAYFWMRHQVRRFTVKPMPDFVDPPLPIDPLPDTELEIVKDRAKLFWDTLRAGETPIDDLVLTQAQLNGFIAHSDYLRGHAYAKITEDTFVADLALPASGLPGGKGRYFMGNGKVELADDSTQVGTIVKTELTPSHPVEGLNYPTILLAQLLAYTASTGTPTLELQYGQFVNWVAPDDWIAKKENLLDCDDDDDDCNGFLTVLEGIESISIEDRQIVVRARGKSATGGGRRLEAATPSVKRSGSSHRGLVRRLLRKAVF